MRGWQDGRARLQSEKLSESATNYRLRCICMNVINFFYVFMYLNLILCSLLFTRTIDPLIKIHL